LRESEDQAHIFGDQQVDWLGFVWQSNKCFDIDFLEYFFRVIWKRQ
jgi:hypothetical protein